MTTTADLRTKSVGELQSLLKETYTTQMESKKSLAAGELPNPRVVGKTRKEVARIKTILSEKLRETKKGDA